PADGRVGPRSLPPAALRAVRVASRAVLVELLVEMEAVVRRLRQYYGLVRLPRAVRRRRTVSRPFRRAPPRHPRRAARGSPGYRTGRFPGRAGVSLLHATMDRSSSLRHR